MNYLITAECKYFAAAILAILFVTLTLWILVVPEFQIRNMPLLFGGPARLIFWLKRMYFRITGFVRRHKNRVKRLDNLPLGEYAVIHSKEEFYGYSNTYNYKLRLLDQNSKNWKVLSPMPLPKRFKISNDNGRRRMIIIS